VRECFSRRELRLSRHESFRETRQEISFSKGAKWSLLERGKDLAAKLATPETISSTKSQMKRKLRSRRMVGSTM
jgi:hypothetical protein